MTTMTSAPAPTPARTEPPGPKGLSFIRNAVEYSLTPVDFFMRLARRYGDFVKFSVPPFNAFLINNADYIEKILTEDDWNFTPVRVLSLNRALRKGLMTSNGYLHEHQKLMMAPGFHHDYVSSFGDSVGQAGARLSEQWEDGAVVEIGAEMLRLCVGAMAEIVFGPEALNESREVMEASLIANDYLSTRSTHPMADAMEVLPVLPSNRRFWQAMKTLDGSVYEKIGRRRAAGPDVQGHDGRPDLMTLMLSLRDAEGNGMTDRQLRDEVITAYTAAAAAEARALTWAWYLLSQNPAVEQKLHEEVDRVLAGRPATTGDLEKLPYTQMVVAETMRLYPPAWVIGRHVLNDYEIGGHLIPAGSVLVMSCYVTQHTPKYFPDPFKFDPERWTPEAIASRPKFTFYPFGGGPRGCIGEPFAWMTIRMLLATMAERWQPRLMPGHPVDIRPLFTLTPKHGMKMRLERRPS